MDVELYVHWSVFVISAIILLGAIERPAVSLVALISYLSIILIHETGHLMAAQRLGCHVFGIELYPLWGITRFQPPWSELDHCKIAWGGVLAQGIIAVPVVAFVLIFGYTKFEPLNAAIALFGGFSLFMIIFNLLPVRPLDGATAWRIIPAYVRHLRSRRSSPRKWPLR